MAHQVAYARSQQGVAQSVAPDARFELISDTLRLASRSPSHKGKKNVATYETGIRHGRTCRSAGALGALAEGSGTGGAGHWQPPRGEGHRVWQRRSQGPDARCLPTADGRDLEAHGDCAPLRGRL